MTIVLTKQFGDRKEAAKLICDKLVTRGMDNALILGILTGGVMIAAEIAHRLDCDLDIALTRKIGAPANPELAVGAVSESGKVIINHQIAAEVGADDDYINQEKARQLEEIRQQRQRYRSILPQATMTNRTIVVVDDGIATGATMAATLWALDAEAPSHTIAAVPVGEPRAVERVGRDADEVVCLLVPEPLDSVGEFYARFPQVEETELLGALHAHQKRRHH